MERKDHSEEIPFPQMKTLLYLLLLTSPLLADSDASLPPNPNEAEPNAIQGGKLSPAFTEANSQAVSWLALVDQGQYGSSWLDAGPIFKDVITRDQWVAAMRVTRQPLGQQRTRKVDSHSTTNSLGYGTRGNFMTITYRSSFSAQGSRIEKVTLMTIQHNQWRVIGYSIES